MNYKDTINLPNTAFKMKASLSRLEPAMMSEWEEEGIYNSLNSRKDCETFLLHDGPPYANGNIHIGHALNKILKDIIVRSKAMEGFRIHYVPGWDCHGLPIEHQVLKKLGSKKSTVSKSEVRSLCREFAAKYVDLQRQEFRRLGCLGDWDNPYLTMDYGYEAEILRTFGRFVGAGMVYKGKKPVLWCANCETALAEAEVEYADHTSPSIFVKFRVTDSKCLLGDQPAYFIIWTTTPWTLVANLAVCLHPALDYSLLSNGKETLIMATDLVESCTEKLGLSGYREIDRKKGADLDGSVCRHPFIERDSIVVNGLHVTLDAGSGVVHTAPGHGQEDYEVGLKYNLDIYVPVDGMGCFTESEFKGINVFAANRLINDKLIEVRSLMLEEKLSHSYPHCWRCKKPVIFRATEQWFISMDKKGLRRDALAEIKKVDWIPKWGMERIYSMIENRPDWCVSRQRTWGVPIPAFYCKECSHILLDEEIIETIADKMEKSGADIWFSDEAILPEATACSQCGCTEFRKETDILDVWFDSGVSSRAVIKNSGEKLPVDIYLEGSDQHRGWFHSSLLIGIGTIGRSPYKSVLTHGFVVDAQGKKMSKSAGNIIAPQKVIDRYGAEVLRLWVAAEDYRDEVRVSEAILVQFSEAYRKIRNTARFMLGNINDFDPENDAVAYDKMAEIDRLEMHRLQMLIKRIRNAYDSCQFHQVFHSLNNYCAVEMSAFYLDILKDRLYTDGKNSAARRSAQSVMFYILRSMTQLMAPIISFTADEIWKHIPEFSGKSDSVHLDRFPDVDESLMDDELAAKWKSLEAVRNEISVALEKKRVEKLIGNSLEAEVLLYATGSLYNFLKDNESQLAAIFIVSSAKVEEGPEPDSITCFEPEKLKELKVLIRRASGKKCERCWNYRNSVGDDAEHGDLCSRCSSVIVSSQSMNNPG